jgi:hypothetical protein
MQRPPLHHILQQSQSLPQLHVPFPRQNIEAPFASLSEERFAPIPRRDFPSDSPYRSPAPHLHHLPLHLAQHRRPILLHTPARPAAHRRTAINTRDLIDPSPR